jgi:indolepyruvate ferredoxin oxidoreductase beta subunit
VLRLTEYLKPGLDEILSVLPVGLASWLSKRDGFTQRVHNIGLHIRTDTVAGFAILCALRGMRRWRRHTSRFKAEHELMSRWIEHVHGLIREPGMERAAFELALAGNLVKGYGQTHARGQKNLRAILADVEAGRTLPAAELTARIKAAREAALADPEGRKLAQTLGLPPPVLVPQPIKFIRNKRPA